MEQIGVAPSGRHGYNLAGMSRLFESFDLLDRGWDVRVLENQSLRSVFLGLLGMLFALGLSTAMLTYDLFHRHHVAWSIMCNVPVLSL
jgi:hypothetical protein